MTCVGASAREVLSVRLKDFLAFTLMDRSRFGVLTARIRDKGCAPSAESVRTLSASGDP